MTILAAGQGLRGLANRGMRSVAEIEAQENATAEQIEAAREAQKMQMYSTGAGIGASYGVKEALAQNASATPAPIVDAVGIMPEGVGVTEATAVVADTAPVVAETVAPVVAETVAPVVGEVAPALVEGASTAAAGSGGTMATLSTIAAPVAIGLGVAFLLNKLFG